MAALNALPLSGGIIDATDLHGPQDWTTPIIITKPVTLRLPCTRLLAKNANLIITPPHGSGRLVGVDVGGCGQATEIVTTGGPGYRNRVIRILGNYSPTLIVPPVGPTATGSSIAGSTIIRAVSDQIPSGGHDGFLETLKIGDSITVVGASLRSPNGMVSPVVALNRNEIVLAREVPITVKTAYLRLSIGGYRLPVTLGSINALSNQLVVGDAGNFAVGDMVRVVGAGPKGADLFSSVAAASDNELMLQSNATLTVVNQIVQYATLAGQTTLSTASVSDASDVLPGDWIHIGEWMNYAANNSDWNRMEWKQIAQVNGTKLIFSEPLQASYGHSAFPGANGCPVFWRKVTGLIERTRIHDLSISSVDGVSAIGVEAQNGRLLEVDHVGVNLRKGLGFFTVNQQGAFIHDNSCGSERCADFGGLTDSRVQNNTFRNVGEGPVAILELGSARNVVRDNQFLNADNNHENPYVAALGGSGIDSNTIEANVVSATHRASCFSILGGSANIIRGNKCTGGIAGVVIQDWPAPDPARIAANNVVAGNVLRNSKIGIDVISTLTTRAARNLNSVQGNDTDSSVVIPLRLFGTTSVETRTTP
ncbi:MAG: hypothetical protein ACRENK_11570 [Gemmatimonadaceae bacterium]